MSEFFEKHRAKFKYIFVAFLLVAAVAIWLAVFYSSRANLSVFFLDVGQGDAIFVEDAAGRQVLIDGGPDKKTLSELARVMPFYDRSIDALILTHKHLDHLTGLIEVLKRYQVDFVFESGEGGFSPEYAEFLNLIGKKGVKRIFVARGARIFIGRDSYLDILLPEKLKQFSDGHENMVVAKLSHGDVCFLLTGDMERDLEQKIANDKIRCQVLKVGHHGSKTSTSGMILEAVNPRIAVIQAGKGNRYGHPHRQVIEKLRAAGAKIFRTDVDGAVMVESDGKNIFVKNAKN